MLALEIFDVLRPSHTILTNKAVDSLKSTFAGSTDTVGGTGGAGGIARDADPVLDVAGATWAEQALFARDVVVG